MHHVLVVGSINMDQIFRLDHLPRPGETMLAGDVITVPGGKGANQAVAAARMGGRVQMVGRLGADPFGRSLRAALIEADVSLEVVRAFVEQVRDRAVGAEVTRSVTPGQQVVKIVHEELTRLLGSEQKPLKLKGFPAPVLLVGLQGTGKTTTCAKLGVYIKNTLRKHVLLVPADCQRLAAREQLEQLGAQAGLPVLDTRPWSTPEEIARGVVFLASPASSFTTGTSSPKWANPAPMAGPKMMPRPKAAPSKAKFWVRCSRGVMSAR